MNRIKSSPIDKNLLQNKLNWKREVPNNLKNDSTNQSSNLNDTRIQEENKILGDRIKYRDLKIRTNQESKEGKEQRELDQSTLPYLW